MKRRSICLFLAGALLLGLTACGPAAVETPSPSPAADVSATPSPDLTTESPTPTPTAEPIFLVQEADVPPGEYEPWQEAYADFLRQLRQKEGEIQKRVWSMEDPSEEALELWQALLDGSKRYTLYDVDKDGTPELFVRYGNWEEEYHWSCYTFQNGKVAEAGDLPSAYAELYTWPEDNSVAVYMTCQGAARLDRYMLEDGMLSGPRQVFYEEIENTNRSENTPIEEILPGTEKIPNYRMTNRGIELSEPCPIPILLPIYDYGALPRERSAPMEESEVRAAIGKVLWEGAELFGASGDGSPVDMGMGTLEEYLAMVAEHGPDPVDPVKYAWADVNGDGQTDCILQGTEVDGLGFLNVDNYIVLSIEENMVYAYFYGSDLSNIVVTPDGTVYFYAGFNRWDRESFYKNQCYRYTVRAPEEWNDLAWEEFPPTP